MACAREDDTLATEAGNQLAYRSLLCDAASVMGVPLHRIRQRAIRYANEVDSHQHQTACAPSKQQEGFYRWLAADSDIGYANLIYHSRSRQLGNPETPRIFLASLDAGFFSGVQSATAGAHQGFVEDGIETSFFRCDESHIGPQFAVIATDQKGKLVWHGDRPDRNQTGHDEFVWRRCAGCHGKEDLHLNLADDPIWAGFAGSNNALAYSANAQGHAYPSYLREEKWLEAQRRTGPQRVGQVMKLVDSVLHPPGNPILKELTDHAYRLNWIRIIDRVTSWILQNLDAERMLAAKVLAQGFTPLESGDIAVAAATWVDALCTSTDQQLAVCADKPALTTRMINRASEICEDATQGLRAKVAMHKESVRMLPVDAAEEERTQIDLASEAADIEKFPYSDAIKCGWSVSFFFAIDLIQSLAAKAPLETFDWFPMMQPLENADGTLSDSPIFTDLNIPADLGLPQSGSGPLHFPRTLWKTFLKSFSFRH